MLAAIEVVSVLLLFYISPNDPPDEDEGRVWRFSLQHSVEDVVVLTCARSIIVSLVYAVGGHYMQRWVLAQSPQFMHLRHCHIAV
jgi:hypothetical protein